MHLALQIYSIQVVLTRTSEKFNISNYEKLLYVSWLCSLLFSFCYSLKRGLGGSKRGRKRVVYSILVVLDFHLG